MSKFSENLKSYRQRAGYTQERAADKLNVSVTSIQKWENGINKPRPDKISKIAYLYNVSEKILAEDFVEEQQVERVDNWPAFAFQEEINQVVKSIHLNLAQQELFGLLYIYEADILKKTWADSESIIVDMKKIPYDFIARWGSIQTINMAEGLKHVLDYVKTDFLLRELRKRPDEEFDLCSLDKETICDYIDNGCKMFDDSDLDMDMSEAIYFPFKMKDAKSVLQALHECGGKIYWTDDDGRNPHREDVPKELKKFKTLHTFPLELKRHYEVRKEKAPDGHDRIYIVLKDAGRKLLQWFKDEETPNGEQKNRCMET